MSIKYNGIIIGGIFSAIEIISLINIFGGILLPILGMGAGGLITGMIAHKNLKEGLVNGIIAGILVSLFLGLLIAQSLILTGYWLIVFSVSGGIGGVIGYLLYEHFWKSI